MEEEEKHKKCQEIGDKQKKYFDNIDIKDYLFATYKGGHDARPLMVAAVSENRV